MFTTGTTAEGSVPYDSPEAVCGSTEEGHYYPLDEVNRERFRLPADKDCPQPIGSVFIANVSRWLMCVIDSGRQTISPARSCSPACLLRNAIKYIARRHAVSCRSELASETTEKGKAWDDDGINPTIGYPRMFIDDSAQPATVKFWDCEAKQYRTLYPGTVCSQAQNGGEILSTDRVLVCRAGVLYRVTQEGAPVGVGVGVGVDGAVDGAVTGGGE